jgi:hypothetical protein
MHYTKIQAQILKTAAQGVTTIAIAMTLSLTTNFRASATNLSISQPSSSQPSASQPQQIAQAAFINQVRDRLYRVGEYLIQRGYTLTHDPSFDQLRQGQSQWINIKLRSGTSYVITALGDQDCRDLDLELYDENGNLVSRDAQTDGTPVMNITPSWTGNFKVRVTLAETKAAYSYYGITFFGK